MKKLITFLSVLLCFITSTHATLALVKTSPTPSPTADISQQIYQELQTKIASQVAQMHLTEKKGIIGTVTDVNNTQISITDIQGNNRFIDVDELTKFVSTGEKNFGISDIKKGDMLGILGLYNKESRRILARFVTKLDLPVTFNGIIAGLDRKGYTLQVITNSNKEITLEVEDVTKTVSYSGGTLTKSGFSKLATKERITVVGFYDTKDSTKVIASRIIAFPDVSINPAIDLQKFGLYDTTVTPSTGSGTKLVPIVK